MTPPVSTPSSNTSRNRPFLSDRRLVRDLLWVLAIKLVLLSLIWWFFIRDQRVKVDAAGVAAQILVPVNSSPISSIKNPHSSEAKPNGQ